METKNYFERENRTGRQFFCHLQVSNKFRKTMDAGELELCDWIVQNLTHRTASLEEVRDAVTVLEVKVQACNAGRSSGPYLTFVYSPLKADENGFVRIERTSGRHQSLLLPIIDCLGGVVLDPGK